MNPYADIWWAFFLIIAIGAGASFVVGLLFFSPAARLTREEFDRQVVVNVPSAGPGAPARWSHYGLEAQRAWLAGALGWLAVAGLFAFLFFMGATHQGR